MIGWLLCHGIKCAVVTVWKLEPRPEPVLPSTACSSCMIDFLHSWRLEGAEGHWDSSGKGWSLRSCDAFAEQGQCWWRSTRGTFAFAFCLRLHPSVFVSFLSLDPAEAFSLSLQSFPLWKSQDLRAEKGAWRIKKSIWGFETVDASQHSTKTLGSEARNGHPDPTISWLDCAWVA